PNNLCQRSEGPTPPRPRRPWTSSASEVPAIRASADYCTMRAIPRSYDRGYFLPALRACFTVAALFVTLSARGQQQPPSASGSATTEQVAAEPSAASSTTGEPAGAPGDTTNAAEPAAPSGRNPVAPNDQFSVRVFTLRNMR